MSRFLAIYNLLAQKFFLQANFLHSYRKIKTDNQNNRTEKRHFLLQDQPFTIFGTYDVEKLIYSYFT